MKIIICKRYSRSCYKVRLQYNPLKFLLKYYINKFSLNSSLRTCLLFLAYTFCVTSMSAAFTRLDNSGVDVYIPDLTYHWIVHIIANCSMLLTVSMVSVSSLLHESS